MSIRSRLLPALLAATCLTASLGVSGAKVEGNAPAAENWAMVEGDRGSKGYSTLN